jgi:predicted transposase YdaD
LIVAPKKETIALAHQLAERVGQGDRERMIEFIETVLLYKFLQMSREEVEAIFTLGDLKKTRGLAFAPQYSISSQEISIAKNA